MHERDLTSSVESYFTPFLIQFQFLLIYVGKYKYSCTGLFFLKSAYRTESLVPYTTNITWIRAVPIFITSSSRSSNSHELQTLLGSYQLQPYYRTLIRTYSISGLDFLVPHSLGPLQYNSSYRGPWQFLQSYLYTENNINRRLSCENTCSNTGVVMLIKFDYQVLTV